MQDMLPVISQKHDTPGRTSVIAGLDYSVAYSAFVPWLLVFLGIFNGKDVNSTMITRHTQQLRIMVKVNTANQN